MEIKGSVIIVTGSGSGIGRAIARVCAQEGMSVVCAGRRMQRLEETVKLIESDGVPRDRVLAVSTDVTDRQQVRAMVDAALEKFGRIDVLFNNAATFNTIGAVWEVDPDAWWDDVTNNLRGPMLCMNAVLGHMMQRDQGVIINMNGGGSTQALTGGSGYGCSKAALLRLTETAAKELERVGSKVMVVSIGPGFVRTETTQLQADRPEGRFWIPSSKELLDAGKSRPPEDCARSTIQLLTHLVPEFNGRFFGTGDDFAALAARAKVIAEKDLFVLRGVTRKP